MSAEWLQAMTAWLAANPQWLSIALFMTAFFESLAIAGIVVPGVALLFAISVMAGQIAMPILEALAWAGAGAIAGDLTSFSLGRLFQGRLDSLWPLSRCPKFIDKGEQFFRRHGGKSVIIGRFVGPVRPVVPLIAGALLMPWRRFLAFNFFSAAGWAPVYILPGYLVGSAMASGIRPPPHFYLVTGVSVLILAAIYLMLFRFRLGLGKGSRLYEWLAARMANANSAQRFWRLYSSHRPARGDEFPLPSLTLGLVTIALFMILSQLVVATSVLESFDHQAADWLSRLRHPLLDRLFVAITLVGDMAVVIVAALLAISVFIARGFYAAGLHVLCAALAATIAVWIFKDVTAIDRPELAFQPPSSGAFPSGHTTGMTVLCALLASFVAREYRQKHRWQHYLLLSAPILLVALSRLYLGVHWFTDIAGGVLLGLGITGLTRASFSRFDNKPITLSPLVIVAALVWGAFCLWYLIQYWPGAMELYSPAGG